MRTMSVNWALKKRANYVECFQYAIGEALVSALTNANVNSDEAKELMGLLSKEVVEKLEKKDFTSINLEVLMGIAEKLGIEMELKIHPAAGGE